MKKQSKPENSQLDKFKAAAKEAECNPNEKSFDQAVKKIATSKPDPEKSNKPDDAKSRD